MEDEPDRLSNRLLEYDPHTNMWKELAPMKYSKYRCSAVVLNNEIFVMGEMLFIYLFKWEMQLMYNPMLMFPGGIGCEGGDRGQSRHCLDAVEIYNPDGDFWRDGPRLPCPQLSLHTCGPNAGVVAGKIYVCGYYKGAGNIS